MSATTPATLESLLCSPGVVPVVTIEDADAAVPMAEALVAGGIPAIEVTLRTDAAIDAIARIAKAVPEAIVGAGTVTTPEQLQAVTAAGARFVVSPGATDRLLAAAAQNPVPLLPGAVTASEVMRLLDHGIDLIKFFPAQSSGGIPALKALAGPFPNVRFCPTGGITLESSADYLKLPNVVCVGGSWIAPPALIAEGRWDAIRELAEQTAAALAD